MRIAGIYRYGVLATLGAGALALVVMLGISASTSEAQPSLTSASNDGQKVFAMAGMVAPKKYGLYLVDNENKTICVYQYSPKDRKLMLMAARTYRFDVKLDSYNSSDPSPAEVRQLVRDQKRMTLTGSGK